MLCKYILNTTKTYYPRKGYILSLRFMSTFVQKLNPMTGSNSWSVQDDDYDHHQEISRSSFADMLHDTERNRKYSEALKSAIDKMHARGKKANVLDIGTGTGLLSMFAVRHGADSVVACEAFRPMSECALKVIERNGFKDAIRVIHKRSTELTVGPDCDLFSRCNILVTEVFDTELIGEGALQTFKHAHQQLLEKDCIVVPESGTVYVQLPDLPALNEWNKLKNIYDNEGKLLIEVPKTVRECSGSPAVHDIQIEQISMIGCKPGNFECIPVFRFDFSGRSPIVFKRSTISTVKAPKNYTISALFMWWELQMDTEGQMILSCAPSWARSDSAQWRDHWMQAIYYLPKSIQVEQDREFYLIACHDEFSLWFTAKNDLKSITEADYLKSVCECGLHANFSRTRIGQMNDQKRTKKYLKFIEQHVKKDSVVLILSDGFYAGLAVALDASEVYIVESNFLSRRITTDFIEHNRLENVRIFDSIEALSQTKDLKKIDVIIGEPYFVTSILPWDNFLFSYLLNEAKCILNDNVEIFPRIATIKGIAVLFTDLHKIRAPLGNCEGFEMKDFDRLIESSSSISDDNVEAQPLWEYPGRAVSSIVEICTLDLTKLTEKSIELTGEFTIDPRFGCNGIAMWIEWSREKSTLSTGPTGDCEIGEFIQWDNTRDRQCLYLIQNQCHKSITNSYSIPAKRI